MAERGEAALEDAARRIVHHEPGQCLEIDPFRSFRVTCRLTRVEPDLAAASAAGVLEIKFRS
jgi:hypothetical protein